jgi:hypothetical protein
MLAAGFPGENASVFKASPYAERKPSRAARDVLSVKIPAEGSHGICIKSPKICVLSHTPPLLRVDMTSRVTPVRGRGYTKRGTPLACAITGRI